MNKNWSTGKIIGVIFGGIAAIIILWISFIASVFQLADFLNKIEEKNDEDYSWSYNEDYHDYDDDYGYDDSYDHNNDDYDHYDHDYNDIDPDDQEPAGEYYDFENDLREDLTYQVAFETYVKDDFTSETGGSAVLTFEYPVISGEAPNIDGINQAIYNEINIVEDYIGSVMNYFSEGEVYEYTGYGYVTYMSEDILSVAYEEYGYQNNNFAESYVVSLNFDMQTGMVLNNTHLVEIDDDFSIDFRERCEKQNGEILALYYLSDQDITEYLTGNDSLIIFYTPLGMEIGFNYYDGWVTVTYQDYELFTKKF